MRLFSRLSLALVFSAAFLSSTSSRAAVVSISHDKLDQCGRGLIFCNGFHAYSLSEIESGAVQLPVFPILPSEFVVVNDTGHTVDTLELSLSTIQLFAFNMQCQIQSSAKMYLGSCNVADSSSKFGGLFGTVTADFTFDAGKEGGIPDGAYFDITTVGFLPGGLLCGGDPGGGGGTGGGGGGTGGGGGGTGGGGGGTGGPPSQ